ncbi:MAG: hypothetical protein K0S29_855 [Gammaproteobacteria bacterium]|jgi:hypothetical protein|nr:hypothetical protein [Gammaproteobacteria bacterium]
MPMEIHLNLLPLLSKDQYSNTAYVFNSTSHLYDYPTNPSEAETLAHSQHAIAMALLERKNMIVMQDGLIEELDSSNLSKENLALHKEAIAVFPKDFPDEFNQMNAEQKLFLLKHGASKTLFLLGEIEQVLALNAGDSKSELLRQINMLANRQTGSEIYISVLHRLNPRNIPFELEPCLGIGNIKSIKYYNSLGHRQGYSLYHMERDPQELLHPPFTGHHHGRLRNPAIGSWAETGSIANLYFSQSCFSLAGIFILLALLIRCCPRKARNPDKTQTPDLG